MDYYVKLKPSAGGRLILVSGVTTYTREVVDAMPGEMYRDIFSMTPGEAGYGTTGTVTKIPTFADGPVAFEGADGFVFTVKGAISDDVAHVAKRQESVKRLAHKFVDGTGAVLGWFWDEFVVGVTNSETQL